MNMGTLTAMVDNSRGARLDEEEGLEGVQSPLADHVVG